MTNNIVEERRLHLLTFFLQRIGSRPVCCASIGCRGAPLCLYFCISGEEDGGDGGAEILGDPYDKNVALPRIPNSWPLGSRHNTHTGQYCHTGNSALGQFCLSYNGAVGQFSQQYRDTPRTATSGPQRPASNLQRSIAFLDTHTKIMSNFPLQQCTY